jgi:hypothetical protein
VKTEGVVNEMADEKQALDAYSAVIADLRSKRDQIDKTIAMLEAVRSGAPVAASASVPVGRGVTHFGGEAIVETAGAFLGMSIVDASKKLLAMRKRTMGNPEIARELQAGGLVLSSAEPANVIGSVLTRRFQQVGDVVKVGRGIWGLKEWYPGRNFKTMGKTVVMVTSSADGTSEHGETVQEGDPPPPPPPVYSHSVPPPPPPGDDDLA